MTGALKRGRTRGAAVLLAGAALHAGCGTADADRPEEGRSTTTPAATATAPEAYAPSAPSPPPDAPRER